MNRVASQYQTLTERFVRWAADEGDIRAVVQVGSRTAPTVRRTSGRTWI